MELVYLWVKEYKNIYHQGFHFSPRFQCKYDPKSNELTIDEKDDYIENFFGENINVTAIVGKNGSGKSSLLELILLRMFKNTILVFKINDKFYYQSNITFKSNTDIHLLSNSICNIDGYEEEEDENLYSMGLISFDLFKEKQIVDRNKNKEEIIDDDYTDECLYSYENLYFNILRDEQFRMKLDVYTQKYYMYKRLFDILTNKFYFSTFNPTHVLFKINGLLLNNSESFNVPEIYQNVEDWNERYYNLKSLNNYAKKFFLHNDKFDFEELLYLYNIMKYLSTNQEEAYNNLKQEKFNFLYNHWEDASFVKEELKRINFLLFKGNKYKQELELETRKSVSDDFSSFFNKKGYFTDFTEENLKYLRNYFNEHYEKKEENILEIEKLTLLLELYKIGFLNIEFLDERGRTFDQLSHGEKNFFIIEFLLIDKVLKTKSNNVFLLLDEIDISFHPEWQKNILKNLKNIASQFKKNIHFILTTHSPFLLSDIPKQNIIFLDTDENGNCKVVDGLKDKKETFGANIHTLLSDSFFMEDGLMGEFAKEKINKIIKYLREDKIPEPIETWVNSKENLKMIIESIGEPFLRNKVLELYYDKFTDDATKKTRKQELEKQKEQIERELSKL